MPQPVDIPSLTLGSRVHDTFLVLDVEPRQSGTGDPFTVLTLGNSTGEIATAPFWLEQREQVAGLRRGHVVQVIGDVASYRDRRQLRVVSLRHLPESVTDVRALLPSVGPVQRYWDTLDGWRRDLKKPRLARVVGLFYDDEEFRHQYQQCPASVRGHHAALGGLLKHTTEVAAIGRTIARASGADLELVVAGALLHDIGKLEAYTWHGAFDHTEPGATIGHVALGALMLDRRLSQEPEPPCTPVERNILLHLILAHHGKREYGSPVEPMTLEAEVLHWADNASAKTASFRETSGGRLPTPTSDWGGSARGEG